MPSLIDPKTIAVAVFIGVYLLIMLGLRELTVASLAGVALVLLTGILTWGEAISFIDFNVLGMLIGVMIMIRMLSDLGFFRWLGIHMANLVRCDPMRMMLLFMCATLVLSSFTIANVVTVLLMAVVMIEIAEVLELDPRPFVIGLIFASNIGGMATSISSLPDILVALAFDISFWDFAVHMWPIVLLNILMLVFLFAVVRKEEIASVRPKYRRIPIDPSEVIREKPLLVLLLALFTFMIAGLILSPIIRMPPGAIALITSAVALLVAGHRVGPVVREVDWETLISISCLLVLVGSLEKTGAIHDLAQAVMAVDGGQAVSLMLVFWSSALVSCFVDNVPFTIALISVLKDLMVSGVDVGPLIWALVAGAGIGGNGTVVASYANIVVVGETTKRGYHIDPRAFAKIGIPFVLLSAALTSGLLLAIYGL